MSSLFRRTLYGQRLANGSRVNGRWVEGAATSISFEASVQPVSEHDVVFLEIARRESKSYTLYTDFKLLALTAGVANPDRVNIDNEIYEVVVEAPWRNNVISHYKYIVSKMDAIEA
jgi:hypothetical protein